MAPSELPKSGLQRVLLSYLAEIPERRARICAWLAPTLSGPHSPSRTVVKEGEMPTLRSVDSLNEKEI